MGYICCCTSTGEQNVRLEHSFCVFSFLRVTPVFEYSPKILEEDPVKILSLDVRYPTEYANTFRGEESLRLRRSDAKESCVSGTDHEPPRKAVCAYHQQLIVAPPIPRPSQQNHNTRLSTSLSSSKVNRFPALVTLIPTLDRTSSVLHGVCSFLSLQTFLGRW